MKKIRFIVLCIFILAGGFVQLAMISVVSAETLSSGQLKEQNLIDFQKWRADIPDYEKRLYDRVKAVNKRSVRIVRISIAILLVSIIGTAFTIGLLISIRRSGVQMRGMASTTVPAKGQPVDQKIIKKLKNRQIEMRNVLLDLERTMAALEDDLASSTKEREVMKKVIGKVNASFDQWENDLTAETSEKSGSETATIIK